MKASNQSTQPIAKPTLFELANELTDLTQAIDDYLSSGQPDPEVLPNLEKAIDRIMTDLSHKIDGYLFVISQKKSRAELLRAEAERLNRLAQAEETIADHLKSRLKLYFETHEIRKFDSAYHTITLCVNGGRQPVWIDPKLTTDRLDRKYVRVVEQIDYEALRRDAERDTVTDDTGETIACPTERGKHLRIR